MINEQMYRWLASATVIDNDRPAVLGYIHSEERQHGQGTYWVGADGYRMHVYRDRSRYPKYGNFPVVGARPTDAKFPNWRIIYGDGVSLPNLLSVSGRGLYTHLSRMVSAGVDEAWFVYTGPELAVIDYIQDCYTVIPVARETFGYTPPMVFNLHYIMDALAAFRYVYRIDVGVGNGEKPMMRFSSQFCTAIVMPTSAGIKTPQAEEEVNDIESLVSTLLNIRRL